MSRRKHPANRGKRRDKNEQVKKRLRDIAARDKYCSPLYLRYAKNKSCGWIHHEIDYDYFTGAGRADYFWTTGDYKDEVWYIKYGKHKSGAEKYLKRQSAKKSRRAKNEDIATHKRSWYHKQFDYWWNLW